jgi:hypothetical protein
MNLVRLETDKMIISGGRKSNSVNSQYLRREDSTPYNLSPFIMPYDATITTITVATRYNASWTAQIHSGGVPIPGAELIVNSTKSEIIENLNIPVTKNQPIELYAVCSGISHPSINIVFQRNI